MASPPCSDGSGCLAVIVAMLAVAAIVAALISLSAIVDPFSWMPSVSDVWAECDDDHATAASECALAHRFPGFWVHAIVNLVYLVVVAALITGVFAAALQLRDARAQRFDSPEAAQRYATSRSELAASAAAVLACGLVPIAVAAL